MGLLVLGEPLSWQQTMLLRFYVKYHGIIQFIKAYNKHKDRKCDRFLWGDEIECLLLHMDPNDKNKIQAQLRANQILDEMHKEQAAIAANDPGKELNITFHPEYANNMLEVTPFIPYGGSVLDLLAVETNMRFRRAILQSKLRPGEFVIYACNFPLFGTPNFTHTPADNKICPNTPISCSTNSDTIGVFALPKRRPESGSSVSLNDSSTEGDFLNASLDQIYSLSPSSSSSSQSTTTPTKKKSQIKPQHTNLPPLGPVLKSSFVPDQVMSPHPRFATLSGNIRRRRGKKVDIQLPVYQDNETDMTPFPDGNIHSDAMGFGMGSCCLQVTFQTHSNTEARFLYDQMAILAPIFLSLSANTPFHRGHIVDTDVRWSTICQSVDDRTDAEKGLEDENGSSSSSIVPLTPAVIPTGFQEEIPQLIEENPYLVHFRNKFSQQTKEQLELTTTSSSSSTQNTQPQTIDEWSVHNIGIPHNDLPISVTQPNTPNIVTTPRLYKSRYSSVDCYISNDPRFGYHPKFNDITFPYHEPSYELLRENGVDSLMAKHIASLWTRDPLVMFHGQIEQDDDTQVNHFESIQSTNWRSVRYKPPSHEENPGFRVEFRTMELNFTDFENAAFSVFLALLARAIVHFELNLYIPLTLVDENFDTAHKNHSVANDKFWFKSGVNVEQQDKTPQTTPGSSSIKLTSRGHCTPCCGSSNDVNVPIESFSLSSGMPEVVDEKSDEISLAPNTTKPTCDMTRVDANFNTNAKLMAINDIINGSEDFIGFIPIVQKYLSIIDCDEKSRSVIDNYLLLIKGRADLSLMTGAQFQRQFILNHPSYQHDSILPHDAVSDLLMVIHGLSNQICHVPELMGAVDPSWDLNTTQSFTPSPIPNDLFNTPTINIPMATLLEQVRGLGQQQKQQQQKQDDVKKNELEMVLETNQNIILGRSHSTSLSSNDFNSPAQSRSSITINGSPIESQNTFLTKPETNNRSNYWKLLDNKHTKSLQHAFTQQDGLKNLQLAPNLKGSRHCVDMQSLHGHAPMVGGLAKPITTSDRKE